MSEEVVNQGGDKDPELGLATRKILEKWLGKESMSLRHAAFIAHGASPEAGGRGLYAARRAAVKDTDDSLTRSIALKPLKTVGDLELYETSKVFQELASKDHKFPTKVKNVLLAKKIIRPVEMRPERHGNTDRFESDRTQVLHAMVEVLADLQLHPSCRKGGAVDGAVVGMDLARTVIANQQVLFDGGKSPLETETIAKLFNEIVPPQVR